VNKSGLIDAVTKTTSLAKRDAEEAVNAFVHVVSKEVRSGRRVVVAGFGSFNPTHRGARMGRNPRTGAPVSISATHGVRFAASGMLKDILNGKAAPPALKVSAKKSSRTVAKKAAVRPSRVAAKTAAKKATTSTTKRVATKATKNSTKKAVRRTAGRAPKKVVGRAPVRKTTRAPARKATQKSARKAAGRSPARKAIKRSAKKAVRRA
jgi:DNA-binding protein HU-beta